MELLADGVGLPDVVRLADGVGLAPGDARRVCVELPELGIGLVPAADSVLANLLARTAALLARTAALGARTAAADAVAHGDRCEWCCTASAGAKAATDSRNKAAAATRAVCKARRSATRTGPLPKSTMLRR